MRLRVFVSLVGKVFFAGLVVGGLVAIAVGLMIREPIIALWGGGLLLLAFLLALFLSIHELLGKLLDATLQAGTSNGHRSSAVPRAPRHKGKVERRDQDADVDCWLRPG